MVFYFYLICSSICIKANRPLSYEGTVEEIVFKPQEIIVLLTVKTNFSLRFYISEKLPLKTIDGTQVSWNHLFPGDGLMLLKNKNGSLQEARLLAKPGFGYILSISDKKVTFKNGTQFLISPTASFRLDGKPAGKSSGFPVEQKIVYRVNLLTGEIGWLEGWTKQWRSEENVHISTISLHPHTITTKSNKITIKVNGSTGITATLTLLGISHSIPLMEVKKGEYEAILTIPPNYYLQESRLLINASAGDKKLQLLDPVPVTIVTQANNGIVEIYPENNAKLKVNKPFIYAIFQQTEVPLNVLTFKFLLDGTDVTNAAFRSGAFIIFHPKSPLPKRAHKVQIEVQDLSGKTWRQKSCFYIL